MARWIIWEGKDLIWSGDGKEYLRGVGVRYLRHPAFEEGFIKMLNHYRPSKKYDLLLILPCAYGKPYSQSFIHYFIIKAIKESGFYDRIHQLIVTNAGVVPRELEEYYPYVAYDWNPSYEDDQIKEMYVEILRDRLIRYLTKFKDFYGRCAAYLRWDSDSYRAITIVEKQLNLSIPNLAPKNIPKKELEAVSLSIYKDPDLLLITPTALKGLIEGLIRLLSDKV